MILLRRTKNDEAKLAALNVDPECLRDDGKRYSGDVIKPWGWEREIGVTPHLSIWRLTLTEGKGTSLHCHTGKTTVLIVRAGLVELETLWAKYTLHPESYAVIEPGVFHRTTALGRTSVVDELEFPPNRSDLVRLADSYGRPTTGYASS